MDTDALKTFVEVHRQGGFSAAARTLHRTQPAISRRLALLEAELGAPLFERMAGGIALSQAGRVLLPHAERVLAAIQDADSAVRALGREAAGPVSLAVVGTLAGLPLSRVLKRFATEHPGVDLRLATARSAEVSEMVRLGEFLFGLRYDRPASADLDHVLLGSEPLRIVCAPEHPLAGRRIAALRELRDQPWLAFPQIPVPQIPGPEIPGHGEIAASHIFGLFLSRGLGEVSWTPVDSLTAQKRLAEAGFGLALMTDGAIEEEVAAGSLATIAAADLDAGLPVCLISRRGGFVSAAGEALRTLLTTGLALSPAE
jgi:DNA-binding transcriptional LysR family regulator